VIAPDRIIASGLDHWIYCVRKSDGQLLWKYQTGFEVDCGSTVIDGRVYFGGEDHYFYCLNLADGALIYKTERLGSMEGSFSVVDGRIYVSTEQGDLFCLNMADGATIEELVISAKGYIIPEMDWEVEKTEQLQARYVVGADGDDSRVAQLVGIGYEVASGPEFYLICELESDWAIQDEVCVVLDPEMTSLLWPLGGNTFRWCFQLNEEDLGHFPFKERSFISIEQPALDQANRESIEALLEQRAPWFTGAIGDVHWSTGAQFTRRLAARFGDHRCWLLGDAAHVTSPAGMQSMNCGLAEAEHAQQADDCDQHQELTCESHAHHLLRLR